MKFRCNITIEDEPIYEKTLKEVPPGMYFVSNQSLLNKGAFVIVHGLYDAVCFEHDEVIKITNSAWGGWTSVKVRPARNVSIEVKGTY